jgi:hypothetical protein
MSSPTHSDVEEKLNSEDEFEQSLATSKRAKQKKETKKEKVFKRLIDEKTGLKKIRSKFSGQKYETGNAAKNMKKVIEKYEEWCKISFPESSFDVNLKTFESFSKTIQPFVLEIEESDLIEKYPED